MNEFLNDFFTGQDVHETDVFDFHQKFTEEVGRPRHFINEAVGEAECGGLEGGGSAGDDAAGGGLHEIMTAAVAEIDPIGSASLGYHDPHGFGEFGRGGGDGELEIAAPSSEEFGGLYHHREKLGDFAFPAAWEKSDEVFLSGGVGFFDGKFIDKWMADVSGFEAGVFEDGFFEREKAEHFIEELDHFWDTLFVPCPDLGADVINLVGVRQSLAKGFCEAEVETGIIH